MEIPVANKSSTTEKIVVWTAAAAAATAFSFAVFNAFSFSFPMIAAVAVAIFLASLVCRYEINIPFTAAKFSPETLFAFWGVVWLGTAGGVIIGTAAAAAAVSAGVVRRTRFKRVASVTLCTFASGAAYSLAVDYLQIGETAAGTVKLLVPTEVILASIVMAVTYYAAEAMIGFVFDAVGGSRLVDSTGGELRSRLAANAITLVATIGLFVVFKHFGPEFGLVFVPIAVVGNLAYKIHLRRLDQKTKEIREASRLHLATVEALATAIDARDQVGVGHVRRTQIYAVGLGKVLRLSVSQIEALETGALLHDIGKLAVPDHILNKPGKLTRAEMEKAKIHSTVGSAILSNINFRSPVVSTIRYHHEYWDGSGYPDNLCGNDIPLTARILSVADAFDTLRGTRPYRAAVSRDEACNFLRARSGSQFDPQLVDVFLRHLKRFEDEIAAQGLSYELESDRLERSNQARDERAVMSYVEQIQSANREVFTLYSLAKEFSSALDLDETLSLFSRKIDDLVPFDTCLVYLVDAGGEHAAAVHATGRYSDILKGRQIAFGEGATGYALKQRRAVHNVDPALDFAVEHSAIGHEYVAMASLPLVAEDRLIGAISLYSNSMSNYEDEHMRLIETISRIASDAIAKSLQHAQAETYALTDPMTGLPNARSLQLHFEKEVKRTSRSGASFQMLMLDLDGFKAVNDTYGHKVGDKMLKDAAAIIRAELRDYDFLARYAGDEFVAIVPETDSHGVLELCRRIEAAVKAFELTVGDESARVGVSVGSACYPNHGETFDQVLIAADKAMYLTKAVRKQRAGLAKWADAAPRKNNEPRRDSQPEISVKQVSDRHVQVVSGEDPLVVELDESHIVSSAVN